jgi:ketosteroid isomerase-like protein
VKVRLFVRGVCVAAGLFTVAAPLRAQLSMRPPAGDTLPSVKLPPALDAVLRDYEKAWRSGDAAAVAALFAEDGFVLPSGRPPARGRAGIEAAYKGMAGGALKLRALGFGESGSLGYIIGAYTYGETPGDQGKFTLTLRRVAAKWLIVSDMDNSSQMMRRP